MKFEWKRLLPKYWSQSSPTDWDWDAILNDILDKAEHIEVGIYATKIDGVTIWTSNWPYAYGRFRHPDSNEGVPSIKTRNRLRALVEANRKKLEANRKKRLRETIEKLRNK